MRKTYECKKCGKKSFWKIRRNHLKCKYCKSERSRKFGELNILRNTCKKIIYWFMLEQSVDRIQEQTNISRYSILKLLMILRKQMLLDVPGVFDGIVEVDETYLGGQWKNKRLSVKRNYQLTSRIKRGRGTPKQPVFGILCRSGLVWAELITNAEAVNLQPLIQKKVKTGSTIMSDTWRGYTGIATKGYVHRLVKHEKDSYVSEEGNHINGLEGFWGYLKRKLVAKGGIRKSRLHLYLGEYVWRYNHRHLNVKEQTKYLLNLVAKI